MYRRIRSRTKITRGRFRGQLKRAFKRDLVRVVPSNGIKGVVIELTDEGARLLGEDLQPAA